MEENEIQIEELIRPYQEKIKKLEDEIREKDLEITRLKFKLMQKNNINKNKVNNFMNPINDINQMNNQFNMNNMMNNQINLNSNLDEVKMKAMDNNKKEPKFLMIKVKMENGKEISIQCKSNDKIEQVLNIFCAKADCKKENYDFYKRGMQIGKENSNSTFEDIEIQVEIVNIFAIKKKLSDIKENNLNISNSNNTNKSKFQPSEKPINLDFSMFTG